MNEINQYKTETLRHKLSILQTIGHYSFVFYPMLFLGFELYNKLNGIQTINPFPSTTHLFCFLISGIIIFFKWNELIIERVYVTRTDDEFEDAVLATANKLNWEIEELSEHKMEAIAPGFWIRELPQVLIERRTNYVEVSSFDSFFGPPDLFRNNRNNRITFLKNYLIANKVQNLNEKVIQNLKEKEERIENESEWNLKNTLKRILFYVISFAFLASGVAIFLYEGFDFLILSFIIIGSIYPAVDVYILVEKMKNKK